MDINQIYTELNTRKFPAGIISLDDFQNGVLSAAMREMVRAEPLVGFATFQTALQVTDYYVFDPNDPQTHVPDPNNPGQYLALCSNALNISDVKWNPGGDWSSLNIYSPGWQMLSQMVMFTGSYFHQPSQMTVLRQKLDTWSRQFGDQGFEVIGQCGDPSAFIRLYPIPEQSQNQVFVEFSANYSVMNINNEWSKNFMQFVEFYYSEALANYYSQTAGINLLGFSDSKSAMTYWEKKAEAKWKRLEATIMGPHGEVARY